MKFIEWIFFDDYDLRVGRALLFVALLIIGVIVGAIGGSRQFDYHYSKNACYSFGKQSNYQVKWADYNYWNYDCLAKTDNGKWISTENLQNVSLQR